MNPWLPRIDDVLLLHEKLILHSGGSGGVRDRRLIESAIARACAAYGGIEAYPDIPAKAAAVGCGLTQNHGFVDGNKRIGMAVMLLILRRNGIMLSYSQSALVSLGLAVAQGTADVPEVLHWITVHSTK